LLQWGNNDEYVLKNEVNKIFASINSSKKILKIYEGGGHGPLLPVDPTKWDQTVSDFLNDN
jgi:esterase/lipase